MDGGRGSDGADREPCRRSGRDGIGGAAGAALPVPEGHTGRTCGRGRRPGRRQRPGLPGQLLPGTVRTTSRHPLGEGPLLRLVRAQLPRPAGRRRRRGRARGRHRQGARPPVRLLRAHRRLHPSVGLREGRRVRLAGEAGLGRQGREQPARGPPQGRQAGAGLGDRADRPDQDRAQQTARLRGRADRRLRRQLRRGGRGHRQ